MPEELRIRGHESQASELPGASDDRLSHFCGFQPFVCTNERHGRRHVVIALTPTPMSDHSSVIAAGTKGLLRAF